MAGDYNEGVPAERHRSTTGVAGLDAVLDGGLLDGSVCLVIGPPGTGKTTLGNQVAFHHAREGATAIYATVLAESHDRLLTRLRSFAFFDPEVVGTRVHYLSLFDLLASDGLDGMFVALQREVRERRATLLVIDGASMLEGLAPTPVEYVRFVQRLSAVGGLIRCTTLLLAGYDAASASAIESHADGVVSLELESLGQRDVRTLRVVKYRGVEHLLGRHQMTIDRHGMAVYPRLESLLGNDREEHYGTERLSTGVAGLDRMLGGGLLPHTCTMLLGTPGSGKTLLGLHMVTDGAERGERGVIATFHEKAPLLADAAASVGLDLAGPLERGLVRALWRAPLELSPDAWAWELLALVDAHRPTRLMIDGLSDIHRLSLNPNRMVTFIPALANELRQRGVTTLMTVEIDRYVGTDLNTPVPAASATMDNGILLRHVELRSHIYRLVSVLKSRQSATDQAIREFGIGEHGITVGDEFAGAAALLTGAAMSEPTRSMVAAVRES